jgi:outer membrane protein TolC
LGKYGNEASFDDYSYEAMIVGLNITMPLYTGGYRLSLMETARLQKEQSSVRIRQKRDEIQKDIVSIRLRMEEARESIETARAMEAAAIRASSLAISAFENGLGTRLSVSEANTNLSGARLNLQNAIFAYRSAWYDWEFATGQYE